MREGFSFNWQESPAHIWFLTTFLNSREPDDHFQEVDWQIALGEPPEEAMKRFLALGLLVPASLPQRMEAQFTVDALKEMLRQQNLPANGKKKELIARLIQTNQNGAIIATTIELYQCSGRGREIAARGTDGRIYPWGNKWQPTYCNNTEARLNTTTPVDQYPKGRSPYDVYDMCGNVWEWTSTIYEKYRYRANDGREDMTATNKSRVIRGGAFYNDSRLVRAAVRPPVIYDWNDYGFRVCVSAPFSPPSDR